MRLPLLLGLLLVLPVAVLVLLAAVAPAGATFPGANGRLAWHAHSDRGPLVRAGALDGRGWTRIGKLSDGVPYAEEQSGRASWSPSGRRIAYLDLGKVRIDVRSPRGRVLRRVTTPGLWDPAWSPDGRELVTAAYDSADHALVRVRLDGTVVRRLPLASLSNAMYPDWSPAGGWIAFQEALPRSNWIWRVRPHGSGLERLGEGEEPSWSPDGRWIAFVRVGEVWVMRADGSGVRRLVPARVPETDIRGVAWSPDGRRIAFVEYRYGPGIERPFVLSSVAAGGGRVKVHRRSGALMDSPDWQPR